MFGMLFSMFFFFLKKAAWQALAFQGRDGFWEALEAADGRDHRPRAR